MIPQHIRLALENGDTVGPDLISEIRAILKEQYPNFQKFFSDGAIQMYNRNTPSGRKSTGAMILRFLK